MTQEGAREERKLFSCQYTFIKEDLEEAPYEAFPYIHMSKNRWRGSLAAKEAESQYVASLASIVGDGQRWRSVEHGSWVS